MLAASSMLSCVVCLLSVALAGPPEAPAGATPEVAPAALNGVVISAPPALDTLYSIGPGDVIAVQVYGEPALSGSFPVSDVGHLDFPLLGPVAVKGLSTVQLAVVLREKLTPGYLVNPSITVSIAEYRSQPVQVLGAVAKPGVYFLRGQTSVLEILSQAGGVARDGVNEVRVTHSGQTEPSVVLPYDQLLAQGSAQVDLVAGDVVFVPQSLVSVMGMVGKPGEIAYRDNLTISSCIAAAGGALPTADIGRIYVLREGVRTRVNLRKILSGKEEDIVLKPGDKIVVGESPV